MAGKAPKTDGERSAAFQTLTAYTGRFRIRGDKWITTVDGAWNVEWKRDGTGTDLHPGRRSTTCRCTMESQPVAWPAHDPRSPHVQA